MNYDIPPELATRINQLVGDAYASPEIVLSEALAALEHRDADLAAIHEGIADEKAGRLLPASESLANLRQKHKLS